MNEFDFSQLNSLKTPDRWIESALNIPQKKYKPLFIRLRPYIIGTAASVVVVAAVLLTLLFNSGGESPLAPKPVFPVQPTSAAAGTVEQTTVPDGSRTPYDMVYDTEMIEETNAAGEVIATYAVPVKRSGDDRDVTQGDPETVPKTDPAAQASRGGEGYSVQPSEYSEVSTADAQPESSASSVAADTTTNTWWNDPAGDYTEQALTEEPLHGDEYSGTNAVTSPAPYRGPLTLSVSPNSPLFNSKFIRLNLTDDRGGELIHYLVVKPALGSSGNKEVTFGQNLFLYSNRTYTLLAYNTKGNSVTATFSVGGSDSVIIYI